MTRLVKLSLILLIAITMFSAASPTLAQSPPDMPHVIIGYVKISCHTGINGVPIYAYMHGTLKAQFTTMNSPVTGKPGYYRIEIHGTSSDEGATIELYVNEILAATTTFGIGKYEQINLEVDEFDPPEVTDMNPPDGASVDTTPDTISAVVSDPSPGVGVNPDSIVFKVDGNVVAHTYNSTSGLVSCTPPALGAGSHLVSLYVEDFGRNSRLVQWSFTITGQIPPASLTLENTTATTTYVGEPVGLKATVYDAGGNPLEGVSVKLYVDDELFTAQNSQSDGTATFSLVLTKPGTYSVYAQADSVTSGTINITVNERTIDHIHLDADTTSIYEGDSVTFTATPYDPENHQIYYRNVTLYIDGEAYATKSTEDSGTAQFTVSFPDPGTYSAYARADGVESNTITIEVMEIIVVSQVQLEVNATDIYQEDTVELTATVRDQHGNPLQDIVVDFYVANQRVDTKTTGPSGTATTTYQFTAIGTANVYAVAADITSNIVTVNISPRPITTVDLTSNETEIKAGEAVLFEATVLDDRGRPVADQNVKLYVNGKVEAEATTDEEGKASFTVEFEEKGDYQVYAEAGEVQSTTLTIEVKEKRVPLTTIGAGAAVAAPIVAAAAIIAVALLKERK